MGKIRCVGILTSGGDAPGMNAAIRAVTRSGICNGYKIKGIYRGFDGLINDEVKNFTTEDVSNIIQTGVLYCVLHVQKNSRHLPVGKKRMRH